MSTETASIEASPIANLSIREREVFDGLVRGDTNREMAERMSISVKTVDTHRGHILKKLALANNVKLALFAVRHGLVTP